MNETWSAALAKMRIRIDQTLDTVEDGFPHYGVPSTGEWITSPLGDWTGGFWNGMLWLTAYETGQERYARAAEDWAERLRPRISSETIFRGFLFYYGAALGSLLGVSDGVKELAIDGARALGSQYNHRIGLIPLGPEAEEASTVGRGETNVDGVPATGLLVWAANETKDEQLRELAINHARTHLKLCIRDDASVCQSVSFDPQTGDVLRTYTHKGIRHDSTWTRAQAWAMLGYAISAACLPECEDFLDAAVRTTEWWIEHVPVDRIAYWDFDAPQNPASKRDTSGTAIAAAAMLKLAELIPDNSERYRFEAEATIHALTSRFLTPITELDSRNPGILTQGCYNHTIGLATEHELIWGDYYLYEALQVLSDNLLAQTI